MTVFEKCRFSRKVSKTRFHIPLFGTVLIFSDIRVYIKKFKNYSTGFQAVTYPTLLVCKSMSCKNFVDMKIFYTKRPYYKIFLYFLCINTLQENPTFRTIRSGPPDRLKQRPGVVPIVNRSAGPTIRFSYTSCVSIRYKKNRLLEQVRRPPPAARGCSDCKQVRRPGGPTIRFSYSRAGDPPSPYI